MSRVHQGKLHGVLDSYLQETLGGQEKPLQKKPTRDGKNIEETWVGTKPKNLHDLPTKPKKITITNENIYIIYIDKFIERRSIALFLKSIN